MAMNKIFMFELPVANMKRAAAFYKKAFGWKIVPWNGSFGVQTVPEDANWVPKVKGAINGEMFRRTAKDKGPVLDILVPSINRAVAAVVKAGGKVVSEKEAYDDWGFYAQVKDTEGIVFGLWEHAKSK
jgi:predicted enzyme related to lactoylglutathione lyase